MTITVLVENEARGRAPLRRTLPRLIAMGFMPSAAATERPRAQSRAFATDKDVVDFVP